MGKANQMLYKTLKVYDPRQFLVIPYYNQTESTLVNNFGF
jgi:hypothetical protein